MNDEIFDKNIKSFTEVLNASVSIILSKDAKDAEFNLAINSIKTIVDYISSLRVENDRSSK